MYFPPIICDVYVGYDMRVFQIKCSLTSVSGIFQTLTIGHLQLLFIIVFHWRGSI